MDKASEAILRLKPVRFEYKSDNTATPQYGLIAEEVAVIGREDNDRVFVFPRFFELCQDATNAVVDERDHSVSHSGDLAPDVMIHHQRTVRPAVGIDIQNQQSGEHTLPEEKIRAITYCLQSSSLKKLSVVCAHHGDEVVVRDFDLPAMPYQAAVI